jgi:hypothetical protein
MKDKHFEYEPVRMIVLSRMVRAAEISSKRDSLTSEGENFESNLTAINCDIVIC